MARRAAALIAAALAAGAPLRAAAAATVKLVPPPAGSIGDITGVVTGLPDDATNQKARAPAAGCACRQVQGRVAALRRTLGSRVTPTPPAGARDAAAALRTVTAPVAAQASARRLAGPRASLARALNANGFAGGDLR